MGTKFVKRKSRIHRQGIFTKDEIKKGARFYKIPLNNIHAKPHLRCAFIPKRGYIYDDKVLNWINHSCEPNSRLSIEKIPCLIASKKISSGEEITLDYNETEEGKIKIKCNCKSKSCRGQFNKL